MNTSSTKEIVKGSKELTAERSSLRQTVDELTMLNDLSLSISGTIDTKKIMDTIVDRSICFIGAQQGNITLIGDRQEENAKMLVRNTCSSKEHSPINPQKTILTWMQDNKKPLRINDQQTISKFIGLQGNEPISSILSVPLMVQSKLIGVLTIYNKKDNHPFTKQDEQLLSIIGSQSAQVLENARLNKQEQELNKIQKEVEVANKIQKQLLPDEPPSLEHYSLSGRNITAESVGGDFYDFIQLDDHKWVICLGDVSGKGLPASLLMSNLQALIRGELPCHSSPGTLLKSVNNKLFKNTDIEKFATVFVGILDTQSHTLTYSSGGHEFPFLIHPDGNYYQLRTGGLPIGIMNNQRFEEETIDIQLGDKLVIYSDGITDNRDKNDQIFGEKKLTRVLKENAIHSGKELLENIIETSLVYSDDSQLFDDITAVVVSRFP